VDILTPTERSENMRRIRSKGMRPELIVRRLLYRLGYRYRLHRTDLPGKPDIVFPARRKVIFVHGCFWHLHGKANCRDATIPKSNISYWRPKLERNRERDRRNEQLLRKLAWKTCVIWECELGDEKAVNQRLRRFLN
jgi:DNA mismatch endonuclease (patch repair protein)